MNLQPYLDRIRFTGIPRPDLHTLQELHRAHQLTIPFENLDVQLRRPVTVDTRPNYEKIVTRRRGGWCFEMNSVMGWALREIGFDVMRVNAGVARNRAGDVNVGNHLCLLVQVEGRKFLVDVGFGGSLREPLPLEVGGRDDSPYRVSLEELPLGYWRFSELGIGGEPMSFDFRAAPADEDLFARKCHFLQTDPQSPFVQTLVVQRRTENTHVSLRGRVLAMYHSTHVDRTLIDSAAELVSTLRDRFDLDVPEAASLWPAICERHTAFFSQLSGSQPPGA